MRPQNCEFHNNDIDMHIWYDADRQHLPESSSFVDIDSFDLLVLLWVTSVSVTGAVFMCNIWFVFEIVSSCITLLVVDSAIAELRPLSAGLSGGCGVSCFTS